MWHVPHISRRAFRVLARQIRQSASQGIEFQELGTITVKGKVEQIRIYRPMPRSIEWPSTQTPGSEPRLFRLAYEAQVSPPTPRAVPQLRALSA